MRRSIGKNILLAVLGVATLVGCGKKARTHSELTGWKFNDPTYGGFTTNTNYDGQKVPPGMVLIEGGTFTMGSVQDDVLFDWNTTPTKQQIRSFYMDEAEVTNLEYLFYLSYLEKVYPPSDDNYRKIYQGALPDTLVWRDALGFNELLSESYLRHPSYADYPVVGVSWKQATDYCKWRTDRVNEKILMDKGVLNSLFDMDSVTVEGKNRFDTGTYLANPNLLFDGDESIYGKGLPVPQQKSDKKSRKDRKAEKAMAEANASDDDAADDGGRRSRRARKRDKSPQGFTGRHVKTSDGILTQRFRLPTEAEWEYAAKALIENREYNTIRGRKKYSWNGRYTRDKSRRNAGDQLANFKQGKGDYSGLAGWSNDGADITIKVRSYDANAFGLYDMSGNVAEWVADVYRPIIDNDANDFNYFRGNVFKKPLIDEEGKVVVVDYNSIEFDTLDNGKIVPKDLPGSIKYVPITKSDAFMRPNYEKADNIAIRDGDLASTKHYNKFDDEEDEDGAEKPRMYNSPQTPRQIGESGLIIQQYDTKKRNTLISNESRVYKGGSWRDREYWLDPAQRRYLPEYMATNYIGFRCATDKLGAMSYKRRRKEPRR